MISYVIPACNEERLLGRTLIALRESARLAGEPFEMIVVDDSSTDRTPAIAASHGARVVHIRRRHLAAARNTGAREARGDMLAFVAADTRVNAPLLCAALAALRGGAVGGGCAVQCDDPRPLPVRILEHGVHLLVPAARLARGCVVFCTRDAFAACGGFDERLYAAEEIAIGRALARQGRFVVLRERAERSGHRRRAA